MAARSISSRKTTTLGSSYCYTSGLNRSQGALTTPRSGYSFSSGYNNLYQGYNFSSYIASSSSGYSTISTTTPVVLRRKSSQISSQEYKTRSKSVDASLLYPSDQEPHRFKDQAHTGNYGECASTTARARKNSVYGEAPETGSCRDTISTTARVRKNSVYGEAPETNDIYRSRDCSISR